jgi:type IV secretory pathway VirB2 component (pilin)
MLSRHRPAIGLILVAFAPLATAQSTIPLPKTGSSMWDKVVDWFQTALNFVTGPYALAMTAVFLIAGAIIWWQAPKEGFIGIVVKCLAVAVWLLNVPVLVNGMRF